MQRGSEFLKHVSSAYAHLYDLVYIRTHPLADLLVQDPSLPTQDRAWQVHHTLMSAIDELDPGPQAPVFSHEWRRHRLMVLRYVDGLAPHSVAKQLAISRRQYYREHEAAIEATAAVLWDHYVAQSSAASAPQSTPEATHISRIELLRLEAARTAQAGRYANLNEVVAGVLSLWEQRLVERELQVEMDLPERSLRASMEPGLLRQLLLALLGYLIERATGVTVRLAAQSEGPAIRLTMGISPARALEETPEAEAAERISAFGELAALGGAEVNPIGEPITGFDVRLPTGERRTVLVVDDNEDTLELFRRYLTPHQYDVATARTTREAFALARRLQPQAITLDLMMPEQDGWDLLRLLLDQPDTRDIPVIVCSVLPQREAALSLGAAAFLPKPVTEEGLTTLLAALVGE